MDGVAGDCGARIAALRPHLIRQIKQIFGCNYFTTTRLTEIINFIKVLMRWRQL